MKDFFGNDLEVGQEVAYMHNTSNFGPPASMRKGVVIKLREKEPNSRGGIMYGESVTIKSLDSGRAISRFPKDIIGNSARK